MSTMLRKMRTVALRALPLAAILVHAPGAAQKLHLRGCDTWSCHRFTVAYVWEPFPDPFPEPGFMNGTARLTSNMQRAGTVAWWEWSARALWYMELAGLPSSMWHMLPDIYFDLGLDPDYYIDGGTFFHDIFAAPGSRTHFVDMSTAASYETVQTAVEVIYADGTRSWVRMSSTVPEPISIVLLGTGLAAIGAGRRVRRRKPD